MQAFRRVTFLSPLEFPSSDIEFIINSYNEIELI